MSGISRSPLSWMSGISGIPLSWMSGISRHFSAFLSSGSFDSAMNNMTTHWDVYAFIYFIGLLLEISDRIYRGVKKNKIIKIIRDKEDRW